jgi:hypothetical protein
LVEFDIYTVKNFQSRRVLDLHAVTFGYREIWFVVLLRRKAFAGQVVIQLRTLSKTPELMAEVEKEESS